MSEQASDSLDKMLHDLPVRQAPITELVRAGHAARRRRQRASIIGVVAVTALVIGGVAVGSNALSLSGRDTPPANESPEPSIPVDLPLNGWKPGDVTLEARISGTLALDENGCVFLDHPGVGTRTYATWPAGYTATTDSDGRVTLRAPDGTEVAHSGDKVSMSGGYGPAPDGPHPCLPQEGEVAYIQSEVANGDTLPPTSSGSQ